VQALLACALGSVAGCAQAVGIGSIFLRRALPAVIANVLVVEQVAAFVPSLGNLSVGYHVEALAHVLPAAQRVGEPPGPLGAVIGACIVGGLWLAVAVWRTSRAEPTADQ
jgi:hypothetical protein